jgi:hypothetical protein
MSNDPVSIIRKLLPFTTAAIIIAALYVGWIFFSRWQAGRDAERAQAEARVTEAQKVLDAYGGNKVTVLNLSASKGVLRRGETAQLCYGVSNAKSVKIDPPVGDLWPSMYRCLDISPTKDTTYTITADDGQGHTDTKAIEVKIMK